MCLKLFSGLSKVLDPEHVITQVSCDLCAIGLQICAEFECIPAPELARGKQRHALITFTQDLEEVRKSSRRAQSGLTVGPESVSKASKTSFCDAATRDQAD